MEKETELPAKEVTGVPARQIGKIPGAKEITLYDSGITVYMRKPTVQEFLEADADKTAKTDSQQLLAMISIVTLFDGKPKNWHDLSTLSMSDYNEIVPLYMEMTGRDAGK